MCLMTFKVSFEVAKRNDFNMKIEGTYHSRFEIESVDLLMKKK